MTDRPRLGFLGAGWIGRSRLRSVVDSRLGRVVAVADSDPRALEQCVPIARDAVFLSSYEALLATPLDGVVIATPSGLHAAQAIRALELGLAVFCQKPLGRNALEVTSVMHAARRVNRPLGVDLCYREIAAFRTLCTLVERGELGRPYAVDATFHNAYSPDKSWANDPATAGGGCLIDLGVHLLDAAAGLLPESRVVDCSSSLHAEGRALSLPPREVEDFAMGQLAFADGAVVRVACSWRASSGAEASIRLACTGSRAGAAVENVGGSFYDFRCELFRGKERVQLVGPPDAWGGRMLLSWIAEVASGRGYREDPRLERVARQLDLLYRRASVSAESQRSPTPEAPA